MVVSAAYRGVSPDDEQKNEEPTMNYIYINFNPRKLNGIRMERRETRKKL
jgi:hypothetical protein